jgi:hypothetical protein
VANGRPRVRVRFTKGLHYDYLNNLDHHDHDDHDDHDDHNDHGADHDDHDDHSAFIGESIYGSRRGGLSQGANKPRDRRGV